MVETEWNWRTEMDTKADELIDRKLTKLAPTDLIVQNQNRYQKVHDVLTRSELPEEEAERLKTLYSLLLQFCEAETYPELWSQVRLEDLRREVSRLGSSIKRPSPSQAKAFHDVRGGTIFHLGALDEASVEEIMELPVIRSLAYDLSKFMRGLCPFLDPVKSRQEESNIRVHTVETYLQPWQDRVLVQEGKPVRVRVKNRFEGAVTCRCVETSALDRTLFNLANNATRFSQEPFIDLVTFQVGNLVRWCILNSISQDQARWLDDKLDHNGLALFQRGTTRGSTGLGLESCTDVVGKVLGVPERTTLVKSGYIGAAILGDRFCAWFHWPIYQPRPGDPNCSCVGD